MKQKFDGRVIKTSGWRSQPVYDLFISDLDVSSLRFLKWKYNEEIRDFHNHFDLNDPEAQKFYKEMLQRKKMVTEELNHRLSDVYASESYQDRGIFFDPETGNAVGEYGENLYGVSYNETYTDIVYEHTNNTTSGFPEETKDDFTDYTYYVPTERVEMRTFIYTGWDYSKDLDDED